MNDKFGNVFSIEKPVIGMIHLSGDGTDDKVKRALEELRIYEGEGVDGAIIENYHGSVDDIFSVLDESSGLDIVRGVNVLGNPYYGFDLARMFGARFVQFDSVQTSDLDINRYEEQRFLYPDIVVLGGVGFKYVEPTGNPLEVDLEEGKSRCDVIVTTGKGTGLETPLDKLREYKTILGDFPLFVGAGVNVDNVYRQLGVADGAIVGSYFKMGKNTAFPVDRKKVHDLMEVVKEV